MNHTFNIESLYNLLPNISEESIHNLLSIVAVPLAAKVAKHAIVSLGAPAAAVAIIPGLAALALAVTSSTALTSIMNGIALSGFSYYCGSYIKDASKLITPAIKSIIVYAVTEGIVPAAQYASGKAYGAGVAFKNGAVYAVTEGVVPAAQYAGGKAYGAGVAFKNGAVYAVTEGVVPAAQYAGGKAYNAGVAFKDGAVYAVTEGVVPAAQYAGGKAYDAGVAFKNGAVYAVTEGVVPAAQYAGGKAYDAGVAFKDGAIQWWEHATFDPIVALNAIADFLTNNWVAKGVVIGASQCLFGGGDFINALIGTGIGHTYDHLGNIVANTSEE